MEVESFEFESWDRRSHIAFDEWSPHVFVLAT